MQSFRIAFLEVNECPLCHGTEADVSGAIRLDSYISCEKKIIPIVPRDNCDSALIKRCRRCDLIFKSLLPQPEDLASLYSSHGQDVWVNTYGYGKEIALIREVFGERRLDVLDIGPGQGGFLRAAEQIASSVSALDFVEFSRCANAISGEFLRGLIDGDSNGWPSERFDLVTLFDVLEHLYDPKKAFQNIYSLAAAGGSILIETGDPGSSLPRKHCLSEWWYLSYLEHHCAWSKNAIYYAAAESGFEVLQIRRCAQKDRPPLFSYGLVELLKVAIRSSLYAVNSKAYRKLFRSLGYHFAAPQPLIEKDHHQILLRKILQKENTKATPE
jgi:SAM-dependent methyltransferase